MELKENERFDDLQLNGLQIIQNKNKYSFTADAVLLAGFCKIKKGDSVIDLGSGSGIISILLAQKSKAESVTGIEIQSDMCEMANRSAQFNQMQDRVKFINANILNAVKVVGGGKDIVVCNPPYFKKESCKLNESDNLAISRHEICITLKQLVDAAKSLLKFGGKFFLVHKADRLAEILFELKSNKLEPKRIRFVQSLESSAPHLVLIESVSGGAEGVIIEKNLVLNNSDGSLTKEAREIYDKEVL